MSTLYNRYFGGSDQSYFLFGPRGTGKSTWLQKHFPEAVHIDLLKLDVLRRYQARPERLEQVVRAAQSKIIIIDEIQKAPELLSLVHSLIEEKQGWQFILTGSSSRKLKRAGVDLLAGRALIRYMHPFMASELGANFSLEAALEYGLVPLIVESRNPVDALKAYVGLYLEEEVKAESLVREIGTFARFLEVASFSHGSILNQSNLARECEISRKLVDSYLDILQDLLISFHLPIFTMRARRKLVAHPKFYYFDAGVYKGLRKTGVLDITSEIDGPALEGMVIQHVRAWNDYTGQNNKLFYWRTRYGVEVDLIIYGSDLFCAIEVKNSDKVHTKDLRGLKSFREDYPEATAILLYRGEEALKVDTINCIPVDDFFRDLKPGSFPSN